ncbi:hypothetical protein [Frankia tisae]|uniref:hypothetical protein n=1 Tax=Frankia tisae TaxID=2950104 RepID=UPI0021BE05AB|nr:hypothetical protein [Frankia tisae]
MYSGDASDQPGEPISPPPVPMMRPLRADEILARRAFVITESTLSRDGEQDESEVGGVTFSYIIPSIMPPEEFPASFFLRVGVESMRHLAVPIPFDLDELPGELSYGRVRVSVDIDGEYAAALQLAPSREVVEVPAEPRAAAEDDRASTIDDRWLREFSGLAAQFGEYVVARGGDPAPPVEARPVCTPFGEGNRTFGWTFQGQPGRPLWHRHIAGMVLLELPAAAAELAGTLSAEAEVRRLRRGRFQDVPAPAREPVRFRVALPPHSAARP